MFAQIQNKDGGFGETIEAQPRNFLLADSNISQTLQVLRFYVNYFENMRTNIQMAKIDPRLWESAEKAFHYLAGELVKKDLSSRDLGYLGTYISGQLYANYENMPIYVSLSLLTRWKKITCEKSDTCHAKDSTMPKILDHTAQ